jgi:hypothetical protein
MGDDAEYYIQQQEEDTRFEKACQDAARDRNRKSLLCWTDGYEDEVWSWEPLDRINDVFFGLHNQTQIGSDYFLARDIPGEYEYEEEGEAALYVAEIEPSNDSPEIRTVDGLEFYVANNSADATHEVIVVSRHDVSLLRDEAVRRKQAAKTLREEMLSEMLEEMAAFIEAESRRTLFVFAREL